MDMNNHFNLHCILWTGVDNVEERGSNFEGDMILPPMRDGESTSRKNNIWPENRLIYQFASTICKFISNVLQ